MMEGVRLITGGVHRDSRGEVRHVNGFDFSRVDRFYTLHPAQPGVVRGWVGHLRDWKWFSVSRGVIKIGVARPELWDPLSREAVLQTYVLSADAPAVLEIPPGHYTASVALETDSILTVFSSGTIEAAGSDDYRAPTDHWPLAAI